MKRGNCYAAKKNILSDRRDDADYLEDALINGLPRPPRVPAIFFVEVVSKKIRGEVMVVEVLKPYLANVKSEETENPQPTPVPDRQESDAAESDHGSGIRVSSKAKSFMPLRRPSF